MPAPGERIVKPGRLEGHCGAPHPALNSNIMMTASSGSPALQAASASVEPNTEPTEGRAATAEATQVAVELRAAAATASLNSNSEPETVCAAAAGNAEASELRGLVDALTAERDRLQLQIQRDAAAAAAVEARTAAAEREAGALRAERDAAKAELALLKARAELAASEAENRELKRQLSDMRAAAAGTPAGGMPASR